MKSAMQEGQTISELIAPSSIPWQVQVGLTQESVDKTICSGTILDRKTILTRARCFYGLNHYQSKFFIIAGISNTIKSVLS